MVGAVLVKNGRIIGRGWHRRAGLDHAEMAALRDARKRGHSTRGATLYVTLEPCSTHGRTPPCTEAIRVAGLRRVVAGAIDPNPKHSGKAFAILKRAGIQSRSGLLELECTRLNEAFNHWIVHHTPFVTVKAAMTLDGRIATASGESKWITGPAARAYGMKLRRDADAILVGINTILADNPRLTSRSGSQMGKQPRRIIIDSMARTPPRAAVVSDQTAAQTTIVVTRKAPGNRVRALAKHVRILVAPLAKSAARGAGAAIDLPWLLRKLGQEEVTSLLVEGGGEVNASFLLGHHANRVAFFYAPKILGSRDARPGVAGEGATDWDGILKLEQVQWHRLGTDLLLTARVAR